MAFARAPQSLVSKTIDIPSSQTGQTSSVSNPPLVDKLMDKISIFKFNPDWKKVEAALHGDSD